MKIAVCSLSLGEEFRDVTKYAIQNKILYCEKHGYDFIEDPSVYDSNRPHAWSKILLVKKYLPNYDYVMWIDADTFIMNDEIKIEDKINTLMNDRDFMVGIDWQMMNSGVFFMKNTQGMIDFLDEIYKQTHLVIPVGGNYEQTAIIELYENNWNNIQDVSSVIKYPRQIEFNSYYYNYSHGHFILHFPGCRDLPGLRMMMDRYCPLRMSTDSDDDFARRLEWLKEIKND